jgi:IS1 family transposase
MGPRGDLQEAFKGRRGKPGWVGLGVGDVQVVPLLTNRPLCRRTLQIEAWVSGDHSTQTCRKLWKLIPKAYRHCHTFSDFWEAYAKVFPKETHRLVGTESGQTCHMERWTVPYVKEWLVLFARPWPSLNLMQCMRLLLGASSMTTTLIASVTCDPLPIN